MMAFFKRECRSYFQSAVGYAFIAAMLAIIGVQTYLVCIVDRLPVFEEVLRTSALVFLLMVPILTMRAFSEERKGGTLQFVYSLPVSMGSFVLGKYLALLGILLAPLLLTAFYPIVLAQFGSLSMGSIAGSFVGFFGMGAALLAIGLFCSALIENQVAAAAVIFVVLLFIYGMPTLSTLVPGDAGTAFFVLLGFIFLLAFIWFWLTKSAVGALALALVFTLPLCLIYRFFPGLLEGVINTALQNLSFYARFYTFTDGVLSLSTLVYNISVAALMVFLSVQVLEYRRCR